MSNFRIPVCLKVIGGINNILGTGVVARINNEYQRDRNFEREIQAFTDSLTNDPQNIVDTAYNVEQLPYPSLPQGY
ncbi:MAG: hypothetical protein AAFV28_14510, partial [Cyanobacteria bacterium J06635_13]